ncbi:hypothetical protein OHD16_21390 [Sphingobacterium sp. ML3W]|uniref:hypothetical protein n=1 Tax=Sphingobacterium sp. ML3W TaxID=1538644 RepID=UPI002499F66D|nr:hypothetical protein [Sphingobacterium sp. ML3W]WFA77286.1 hypothetical protein OGI71_14530 [Sphingobacterium sp. ML3W]
MWKAIGIIGIVGFFGILSSCSIFRNSKKESHVSELKQSAKLEYELIDTSKVVEIVHESLNVELPVRSYPIDVPILNGNVNFVNSLYTLTLKLDSSTNRLSGVFSLPDTLLKGERTSIRTQQNGIVEKKKEETKSSDIKKEVTEQNSVSWKTVAGVVVVLLVIIGIVVLAIRNYRKSRN